MSKEEKFVYVITTFPNHAAVPIRYDNHDHPTVFLHKGKAEKEAKRLNDIKPGWSQRFALFYLGKRVKDRFKVIKYLLNDKA